MGNQRYEWCLLSTKAKLLLLFLLGIASFQIVKSDEDDEEDDLQTTICKDCTKYIHTHMGFSKHFMESVDPMLMRFPEPCKSCRIDGISKFSLIDTICPINVTAYEENQICYDHPIKFYFPLMKIHCDCNLPINTQDLLKKVTKQLENPLENFSCNKGGKTAIDPEAISSGLFKTDPMSVLKMPDCAVPKMFKMPKISFQKLPEKAEGQIYGSIKDFKMNIVFRICNKVGNYRFFTMRTTEMKWDHSMDYRFNAHCKSTGDENFMEPCNCLLKTDYLKNLIFVGAATFLPCLADLDGEEVGFFAKGYSCNEVAEIMAEIF